MSFEYRELTTKVFLNAGEGDKSPCRNASCQATKGDGDDDDCCGTCGTTTKGGCGTNTCPDPPDRDDREGLKTLALLQRQLRDSLSAG